jgi:hypothetical protein
MLHSLVAEQKVCLAFWEANLKQVPNSMEHPELCAPLAYEIARTKNRIDELERAMAA